MSAASIQPTIDPLPCLQPTEQLPLPTYLQLEPVGQCNLRCQMCPIQYRNDGPAGGTPAFMKWELFTRIVDQFPRLEELHLQGLGEPMMHPRFFDMVEYAARRGTFVSTNTNLTVFSPLRAQRCVTSGLGRLHISIDAASPATYARIRVGSRLDRVERNLGFLQEARRRAGGQKPKVELVTVIMRQNLHELPAVVQLADRWDIRTIFVQHLCHDFGETMLPAVYRPMRSFVNEQTLLNEDLEVIEEHFSQARQVAQRLGVNLRLPHPRARPHPPGTPGRKRCNWPWNGMYVSYQGFAMPCCMIATPDRTNFGNLGNQDAQELWNNGLYATFRGKLDSDTPPEICRSCSIYNGTF